MATQAVGILTAEDRIEIQQLISEYTVHDDTGNAEAWAAVFTKEGSFVGQKNPPVVGRENLAEFARRRWTERPHVRNWLHLNANVVIWPTPEGAASTSYQLTVERKGDEFRIIDISGKSDELRLEDGRWKFHVRRALRLGGGA